MTMTTDRADHRADRDCADHVNRFYVALSAMSLIFFAACGEDGDGDGDTLLTGFSGLVIVCLVIWGVVRYARKRGGGGDGI
jgi:hypothetical protein